MRIAARSYALHDLSRFFANVFGVMSLGLAITGAITLWISHDMEIMKVLFNLYQYTEDGETKTGFHASVWWWSAALLELGLVVLLCWVGLGKGMSAGAGLLLFGLYSALNGVTLAPVIFAYTDASA